MKRFSLIFFLGAVCALAFRTWLPTSPSEEITKAATFVDQLERAKLIDRDTTYPVLNLVASLRDIGPQPSAIWEARRLTTIARLQAALIKAGHKSTLEAQALASDPGSSDK
jgi:hypothetical protein